MIGPKRLAGMTRWWTLQNNDKVYDNLWNTTASGEPLRDPSANVYDGDVE